MIKKNDLYNYIKNYLKHDEFMIKKYTLKHDNKKGYLIVLFNTEKSLPVYSTIEGLTLYQIQKGKNFLTYELV